MQKVMEIGDVSQFKSPAGTHRASTISSDLWGKRVTRFFFNHHAHIQLKPSRGGLSRVVVRAPVRGSGLRETALSGEGVSRLLHFINVIKRRSRILARELPNDLCAVLLRTGLLLPKDKIPRPVRAFTQTNSPNRLDIDVAKHARDLKSRKYTVIRNLLPQREVKRLADYYDKRIGEGFVPFGDRRVPFRFAEANESTALSYLKEFSGFVSELKGSPMEPVFTYSVRYEPGACLPPHTDQVCCETTISLLLSHQRIRHGAPWPIHLRHPEWQRSRAVLLKPGDALIYHGRELIHSRPRLPRNEKYLAMLLHYKSN
jgi:hypothetical protein